MSRVFISYRRDDSADVTGRIFDRLRTHFDRSVLFMDVDAIPLGQDFREVIRQAVESCEVLLAVIGAAWIDQRNEDGARRLEDPNDFVRLEIETALKRGIPVIPVLVGRAKIPKPEQLPESLQPLAFRSGLEIRRDPDFHPDMDRLIRGLTTLLKMDATPPATVTPGPAGDRRKGDRRAPKSGPVAVTPAPPPPGETVEYSLPGGLRMRFCWIPPGTAQLGSPKGEQDVVAAGFDQREDWLDDESEANRGIYTCKGFWLGASPVTQAEWLAVMGDCPSCFRATGADASKVKRIDTSAFPVENVSWDDVQVFLETLNARGGIEHIFRGPGSFQLPHEDAWEYACRGGLGNDRAFYWGDELNGNQANCDGRRPFCTTRKGPYLGRPSPVGSYAAKYPHPWGLCDMHGNVWEWCANRHEQTEACMLRGGSWYGYGHGCRAAYRSWGAPDSRSNTFGFRVALCH